jgi:hypothetical protein
MDESKTFLPHTWIFTHEIENSDLSHFTSLRFDINFLIDAADFYHLRTSANAGTDHNKILTPQLAKDFSLVLGLSIHNTPYDISCRALQILPNEPSTMP